MKLRILAAASSLLVILGCGSQTNTETYPFSSLNDIILTQHSHPHGYNKTQCFNCHMVENIHQVDHLNSGELPTAIALTQSLGINACSSCHGQNGVSP